jgi:integrase/recombinase XerD
MQKVSLYTRDKGAGKQRCRLGTKKFYPVDTTFVLRYGTKWETLPEGTTLGEANLAAVRRQIELQTGKIEPVKPKPKIKRDAPKSLDVLIDEYLSKDHIVEMNWRKRTVRAYKQALQMFHESCGNKLLDEISGDDLRKFKLNLRKYRTSTGKPYDDRSIWNHFNNMVSFLNAHDKRNLVEGRDWPKFEQKKIKAFDEADIARLMQFADEDEADVLEFYLGVGFRNGEGEHVEWPDIDLRNKEIHVYSKRDKFGWEVKDSEQRIVGISDRLTQRLTARHKRYPGNGLVFPNTVGNPDKHLLRIIKRVALRAGLNCGECVGTHERKRVACRTHPICHRWILHTMRKTWATYQVRSGVDPVTVQEDLGHSSLVTTLGYLSAEDRRSSVRRTQINAADERWRQHIEQRPIQ